MSYEELQQELRRKNRQLTLQALFGKMANATIHDINSVYKKSTVVVKLRMISETYSILPKYTVNPPLFNFFIHLYHCFFILMLLFYSIIGLKCLEDCSKWNYDCMGHLFP